MNSLAFILVFLGAFLPSSFGAEENCPGKGDGRVDFTAKGQVWYYCQTSLANRTTNNCYVDFKNTGEGKADAVVHTYDLKSKAEGRDSVQLERISNGTYNYPDRGTTAMNIKVSRDGKCLTYWKCHDDAGNWNGVPGSGAYFMFLCNNPKLCKPQSQYEGNYKTIFDEAKTEKNLAEIFDLDQTECKKLKIEPRN